MVLALHEVNVMYMTLQTFDSWEAMDATNRIRVVWGALSLVFVFGMVSALGIGALYFGRNILW